MSRFACNLITGLSFFVAPVMAQTTASIPTGLEQQVLDIIKRNPQAILDTVRAYQQELARAQRREEWKQALSKPIRVDISQAPLLGPTTAPLTLIEFADFQCSYCAKVQPTLKALVDKYKDTLHLAYMHTPVVSIHEQAKPAALAAWAAAQQGKFFEYHDRLYAQSNQLTAATYLQIAQELNLNLEKFEADRQSPQALAQIKADLAQADRIKVNGTPTFVLNGVMLRGAVTLEDFEEVIRLVLSQDQALPKS